MKDEIKSDYPICFSCKHFFGVSSCDAFLNKIPDEIFSGDNDHSKPLPEQDNKIVFEPVKESI